MIISVKNDCGNRAYAGPVLSYHESIEDRRWTDEDWKLTLQAGGEPSPPAWSEEFVR